MILKLLIVLLFNLFQLSSAQQTHCSQHNHQQCTSNPKQSQPIILIGMRGTGKTTLSQNYAHSNRNQFIDIDHLVFQSLNITSFQQYYQQNHNAIQEFRKHESQILSQLIQKEINNPDLIISTGGGIILQHSNRQLLKKMKNVVFLQYDDLKQSYLQSIQENNNRLDCDYEQYLSQFNEREPLYQEVSKHTFRIGQYKQGDLSYWDKIQLEFNRFIQILKANQQ